MDTLNLIAIIPWGTIALFALLTDDFRVKDFFNMLGIIGVIVQFTCMLI